MKVILVFVGLIACARGAAAAEAPPAAVRCGRLLDVRSGNLINNVVILTAAGKITAAGPALAIPSGMAVIELPQGTCLPRLLDVHVHTSRDPTKPRDSSPGTCWSTSTVTAVPTPGR